MLERQRSVVPLIDRLYDSTYHTYRKCTKCYKYCKNVWIPNSDKLSLTAVSSCCGVEFYKEHYVWKSKEI
jgi:hypothetical protein